MLKEVVLTIGILMILKGLIVHFYRGPTIKIANRMVKEVLNHKKYKLINFFALLDVILGLLLIWIAFNYYF